MKNTNLRTAILTAFGVAALVSSPVASAAVTDYNWSGLFTFLDSTGAALANPSINTRGANQFQDVLTGTLAYDHDSGTGSAALSSFDWGGGINPMSISSFNLQAVGDGLGGSGSLILGNMLFNWSSNNGIPVSIVLDGSGFLSGELTSGGPLGAVPASDGTYVNATWGYLATGPVPIATTDWNLTTASDCGTDYSNTDYLTGTGCMNNPLSGVLPLVEDLAININKPPYDASYIGTGTGIGGVPMPDGPFAGLHFNVDFTELSVVPEPSAVPVPSAVWLFGSGLLGLIGVARRKKAEVGAYK